MSKDILMIVWHDAPVYSFPKLIDVIIHAVPLHPLHCIQDTYLSFHPQDPPCQYIPFRRTHRSIYIRFAHQNLSQLHTFYIPHDFLATVYAAIAFLVALTADKLLPVVPAISLHKSGSVHGIIPQDFNPSMLRSLLMLG